MKTIGQYLKNARKERRMTFSALSDKTKIRVEFLKAIEKERWRALPEFTVVSGFVKNMADAVGMDRQAAAALLRRDYPPSQKSTGTLFRTPEMPKEFRWSPRLTYLVGVGIVVIIIAAYLVVQYIAFTRPPMLIVDSPKQGEVILQRELEVNGKTDPNTSVIVNTQPALVSEDGSFHTTLELTQNSTTIEVKAKSRSGKETVLTFTIKPEF